MLLNCSEKRAEKRRVLAVVRYPVGGVRTHILYTYPHLIRAGYRFSFVIPQDLSHAPFLADVRSWDDVEVIQVPYADRRRSRPKFRSAIRSLLKQGRFALIHSHGIKAAIPAIFANVGIGLPHVMTSQDVFCHVELSGIAGRLKLCVLERILRRLDMLIAVSEDVKTDHLHYMPGLEKGRCRVEVIYNGIDLQQYPSAAGDSSENEKLRQQIGIGNDVFLMGFLGRFMEQKGFLCLIEALDRLLDQGVPARPVHLLAVGSGDCLVNYRWELDRHPRVKGCITFLEHVPNAAPILRGLDLLVMPSLWEACPILPMEAMCMGVPVLGTDCVGLREVLQGSPSVMVPTGDANALASALDRAMASPLTESARRYVPEARRRFDAGSTAERLSGLIDKLTR